MFENEHLARMIEWLDEERRRDKGVITTLEERLAQQTEVMQTLQRRLAGLESDQASIQSSVLPAQREAEIVDTVRREMNQLVEQANARRLTAERELERRLSLVNEQAKQQLREMEERVEQVRRSTSSLNVVRDVGERAADNVSALQQMVTDLLRKVEDLERRLSAGEEQRRQADRRLSEIDNELPDMKRGTENNKTKLQLVEDLTMRNERRIIDIHSTERERRDQMQQFIDQQTLLMQQRDSEIEALMKRFSDHDEEMQSNSQRFAFWEQTHREMRHVLEEYQRITERFERRLSEVAEMQRLSEDRFREEWNAWGENDQKRWKTLTLSQDEIWRNHDREFEQFVKRFEEMTGPIPPLQDSVRRLWAMERERAQMYRDRYQALLLEYDTGTASGTTTTPTTGSGYSGNGTNGTSYR